MLPGPMTPRCSPIAMLLCDLSGDSILLGKMWCATVKRASPNGQEGNSTLCKRGITLLGRCNRPRDIGWRDTVLSSPTAHAAVIQQAKAAPSSSSAPYRYLHMQIKLLKNILRCLRSSMFSGLIRSSLGLLFAVK